VITLPIAGAASDRFGRKPVLLTGSIALMLLSYPIVSFIINHPSFSAVSLASIFFGALIGLYAGPTPATMAEMFATRHRYFGVSLGYNIAAIIFGGFAPYISSWLISTTNRPISVVYLVIVSSLVSTLVVMALNETAHRSLD
jgi:MHS family proline/betaine transporter-like MFS transporter